MGAQNLDNISDMLVLARVAEGGSLSAGGRSLGLSPAVASKRILRLEARLGVRLLNRTSRRLSLTEAGQAYHARCVRILADVEEAEAAATTETTAARGQLTVTAAVAFGRKHVAPAVADFAELHPEVTVDLNLTDSVLDLVEHRIDVAIRIGLGTDETVVARRLATNRRVVCASPAYLARRPAPETPADLARHNCLVLDRPQERQDVWHFKGAAGPQTVRVSGTLQSNNGEVLHDWALAGKGLVWKSSWDVADDLRTGRLVPVLCGFATRDADIHALYAHRRLLPARTRAFLDFVARRFGPEPYWEREVKAAGAFTA